MFGKTWSRHDGPGLTGRQICTIFKRPVHGDATHLLFAELNKNARATGG